MFMLPLLFADAPAGGEPPSNTGRNIRKGAVRRAECAFARRTGRRQPIAFFARLAMAEAKTKSFSSRLSVCRMSSLVPSHHLRPFVDVDDLLPDLHDGVHVVGVDDRGDVVLLGNLVDQVVDDDRGLRIEARVGLVAEEVARVQDDRARDGHALDHAARQLRRVEIVGVFEPHAPQAEIHALAFLGLRLIGEEIQRQADVLRYGRRVQQRSALKDHADVLADRLALLNPSAV